MLALTEQAAVDADLVVLPEMALPGYVFAEAAEVAPFAEPADGPTAEALAAIARRHSAWIVAGLPERDGERLYNSAWGFDPTGARRFVYRKTLLFPLDEVWAEPGCGDYPLVHTPFGRMGVGICMDLNDPAFVAWVREAQIDVLAFPTNWLDQGEPVWDYWAWRLDGAASTLVAANRWGIERGVPFRGESAILQGDRVLASGPRTGDAVVLADLPSRVAR